MVKKIFTFNIVDMYKLKSGDDVEMKRTIFNNLVFCTNIEDPKTSNIILMNLRTFRRELISYAEYIELCDFENGKTKEVPNIYNRLRVKKQILSETEKASFDEQVYKKSCEDKIVRQQNDGVLITDIAIFPTYSCNFKCKYCYESSFLQSAFLTERDIDKICKFIQEINQTDVYWKGINSVVINGGECIQEKTIPIVNKIITKFGKNPKCDIKLYTNGSNVIQLKEKVQFDKINMVQVSLDGDDEIIQRINGVKGHFFDRIIEGILYLSEHCKFVKIECMLTRESAENLQEFVKKLSEKGIFDRGNTSLNFSCIQKIGETTLDPKYLTLDEYIKVKNKFSKLNTFEQVHFDGIREVNKISALLFRKDTRPAQRVTLCNVDETRNLMFAPNGKAYWCICTNYSANGIGAYGDDANIEESVELIWKYINRNVFDLQDCKECEFRYICLGGCTFFAKSTDDKFCGLYGKREFWDRLEQLV